MKTVMCFGDSNTHGSPPMRDFGPNPRYGRDQRWPGVLAGLLGYGWHVVEEGLGGRTTLRDDPVEGAMRNGLRALPGLLHSHKPLDLVIVMLGTNDVKWSFGMSPYEIGRGADKLLRVIAASECGPGFGAPRMLLIAPPPVSEAGCLAEMYRGGAEKSRRLAAEFEAVARARGAGFLDAGGHAKVSPIDGVHWEAGEHASLAAAVAGKIGEMFGGE
ncbi:SGNH/GDSL hydrolase family protein [Seohaeicola nanhaiensis]|uniref:SGNH/GDSL hydrolase family protein n=1 Tax=Seohaeicola nanhaiensis TaxID=1387282 RepID=A0ABV9KFD7_9RHOB